MEAPRSTGCDFNFANLYRIFELCMLLEIEEIITRTPRAVCLRWTPFALYQRHPFDCHFHRPSFPAYCCGLISSNQNEIRKTYESSEKVTLRAGFGRGLRGPDMSTFDI